MSYPFRILICLALTDTALAFAEPAVPKQRPLKVQRYEVQGALRFEPNVGQADAATRYIARGSGYSLSLFGTS